MPRVKDKEINGVGIGLPDAADKLLISLVTTTLDTSQRLGGASETSTALGMQPREHREAATGPVRSTADQQIIRYLCRHHQHLRVGAAQLVALVHLRHTHCVAKSKDS